MIDTSKFYFGELSNGLCLKNYLGSEENVIIPDEFTSIGSRAFVGCESVKTVTIPASVRVIGSQAFSKLQSLERVFFSEGLEIIESQAFFECANLKEANLPQSLQMIDFAAFCKCEKLEKMAFGKNLKMLSPNIIYRCDSIQSLVIPEHIQKIDDINGMAGLTSLYIESDLKKNKIINFIDCANLTEVRLKAGFKNLKGLRFVDCPKLEQATIGDKTYPIIVNNSIGTLVLKEGKTKPVSNEPVEFSYNEKLEQFGCDYKDILFVVDHEPNDNDKNNVRLLAENYIARLDKIVKFMLPDIKAIYGRVNVKDVKAKLGKPTIDLSRWTLSYLEQSFDGDHIFEMEFTDNEFKGLENFTIDG